MVDPLALDRIKIRDPHPVIQAFVIGHEGEANFHIPNHGIGTQTFHWVKKAVGWIHDRLSIGTKVFNRHGENNDHTGRKPIGEVVGKTLVELADKTSAIAAFYIEKEYQSLPLDVASIEADIEFGIDDGGQSYPTSVQQITGVALSNSSIDQPGFPGATLLGASIAAFHGQALEEKTMTTAELKTEIGKQGIKPSQIFTIDDIKADEKVVEFVKTEKQNLYEQNQRLQSDNDKLKDESAKKDNLHSEEVKKLSSQNIQGKASTEFEKIVTERKLTKQQADFIRLDIGRFNTDSDNIDGLASDLNKFIDTEIMDMKVKAELLGGKLDETEPDLDKKPDQKPDSKPSQDRDDGNNNIPDEENPLIPGSKAYAELEGG